MDKTKRLFEQIEEMPDPLNVTGWSEFLIDDIKTLAGEAVLVDFKGEEHWIPYSQLRNLDGDLYASDWILEKKGIEV